jgi:hypothetical protein
MTATATRERVYILAASAEQADIFARKWVAEDPARRLVDARYVGAYHHLHGVFLTEGDRVVEMDGADMHPKHFELLDCLHRWAAKTRRPLNIERVTS